ERAREAVHLGADVESLELQPDLACRGEKRADVAPDLEPGAAPPKRAQNAARLHAIGAALRLVQPAQQVRRRRRVRVDGVELVRPLDRIAIDETAAHALDDAKGW